MTEKPIPPPKVYIPREERINIWSHAIGAVLAAFGMVLLCIYAHDARSWIGAVLYGVSLVAQYTGSAVYHAAKEPAWRAKCRLFDHSAIYLLIAGTYTPLMLVGLPTRAGMIVQIIDWLLGLTGITLELLRIKPFKGFSILLYILMGWLCMAVLPDLLATIGRTSFLYLLWGGIAYTAGVPFYILRKNYSHALWHVFVLAGSLLHFLAVLAIYRAA